MILKIQKIMNFYSLGIILRATSIASINLSLSSAVCCIQVNALSPYFVITPSDIIIVACNKPLISGDGVDTNYWREWGKRYIFIVFIIG